MTATNMFSNFGGFRCRACRKPQYLGVVAQGALELYVVQFGRCNFE